MKTLLTLCFIAIGSTFAARADFVLQPNDVLGIGGDSITEQHLYSAFMEDYLLMCQPTPGQNIVQFGWGGEGSPSFLQRLDTDVYPFKPTVMTTNYGMNDGGYQPLRDDLVKRYQDSQKATVDSFKQHGVRVIILGSPKCVDTYYYHRGNPDPTQTPDLYNKVLSTFADEDKQIAQQEGVIYADVYGTMFATMQKSKAKFGDDYNFAGGDGVHPSPNGHLVMAYTYLKAMGCDGNIGTITIEPALNRAEATPGHEIVSYDSGTMTATVKSSRYPFCFSGTLDNKDPNTTAAVTQFFPFNDDLNRFTLVVSGLSGSKAKVTYGGTTKEYPSDQLAKGINLATEFLQNPFVDQFNKVHAAVTAQQELETLLVKQFMHNQAQWAQQLGPQIGPSLQNLVTAGLSRRADLFKAAQDLVVPITYTIKVEPEP